MKNNVDRPLFLFSLAISLLFVGTMALHRNLSEQTLTQVKIDHNVAQVLGKEDVNTTLPTSEDFFIYTDSIPFTTTNEYVTIKGMKPRYSSIELSKNGSTPALIIERTKATEWDYRVKLKYGENSFEFINKQYPHDGSNTGDELIVTNQVNITRIEGDLKAELTYSKNPAPEGILKITAQFNAPLATVPQITLFQQGSVDIEDPIHMTGNDYIWYFDYRVNLDDGIRYKNGVAEVKIQNSTDIYGRRLAELKNNTFKIEAAKVPTTPPTTDNTTTDTTRTDTTTNTETADTTKTDTTPNTTTTDTATNTTTKEIEEDKIKEYSALPIVTTFQKELDLDLSEELSKSYTDLINQEQSEAESKTVSRLVTASPLNNIYRFSNNANIRIEVIYKRDAKNKKFFTGQYAITGYKYDTSGTPLFIDFSGVDSEFKKRRQTVSAEEYLRDGLYRRVVSYRLSKENKLSDINQIPLPVLFSNMRGQYHIFDNLKVNIDKEPIVGVNKISVKKQKTQDVVEKDPFEVEEVKCLAEDIKVNGITFSGYSTPNTLMNLYIYSDPVTITVRTNDEGKWSYTLKEDLEVGAHTVYASLEGNENKPTDLIQIADFKVFATDTLAEEDIYHEIDVAKVEFASVSAKPEGNVIDESASSVDDLQLGIQNDLPMFIIVTGGILIVISLSLVVYYFYFTKKLKQKHNKLTDKKGGTDVAPETEQKINN